MTDSSQNLLAKRARFNEKTAAMLVHAAGWDVASWAAPKGTRLSSRFQYFDHADILTIVCGEQEGRHAELALAYGLTWRGDRHLRLVLPERHSGPTLRRLAWMNAPVTVHTHVDLVVSDPQRSSRAESRQGFKDLKSDNVHQLNATQVDWIRPFTEWLGTHPALDAAHRPNYRAWHCHGLTVAAVKSAGKLVEVRAGIDYTKPVDSERPALVVQASGPLSPGEIASLKKMVLSAIKRRESHAKHHKSDEHWLQAELRRRPWLVGLEAPTIRELAAWRCSGGTATKPTWGRGFIDLLGPDAHGSIRIVETKLGGDDLLILQGLDYLIWAEAHRQHVTDLVRLRLNTPMEIHYVVAGKKPGVAADVSAYARAQVEALAPDVNWSFHEVTGHFGEITVERLGPGRLPGPRAAVPSDV